MEEPKAPSASPTPPTGDASGLLSSQPLAEAPASGTEHPGGRVARPLLLGALGGAAAVVVIGAVLVALGAAHFGSSSSSSVGTASIIFPRTLAGFEDQRTLIAQRVNNRKAAKQDLAELAKSANETTAIYRQAYGGAAVGFRAYGNRDLSNEVTVIGVRADSPGLTYGPVIDAAALALNAPPNEVVRVGAVSCLVSDNDPAPAGTPVNPSNEVIQRCQRSGDGLTVAVFGNLTGNGGRQTMVTMTNEAWAAASES